VNWEAIGAIAELLGAIGVITTLIYLSIQIRQNTHALDETHKLSVAQAYQHRAQMQHDDLVSQRDSPHLAELMSRLEETTDLGDLSSEDVFRLNVHCQGLWARLDNVHRQGQLGLLDEDFLGERFENQVLSAVNLSTQLELQLEHLNLRPSFLHDVRTISDQL
jgi:hypothetical protein